MTLKVLSVPPALWPGNLPDPVLIPFCRLRGIHDWLASIPNDESWRFIQLGLGWPQVTPPDSAWEEAFDVVKVFVGYCNVSDGARMSFRSTVKAVDVPDDDSPEVPAPFPRRPGDGHHVGTADMEIDGVDYVGGQPCHTLYGDIAPWPKNLPSPKQYTSGFFLNMQRWSEVLTDADFQKFVVRAFAYPPKRNDPSERWLVRLNVVDVYLGYLAVPGAAQVEFVSTVLFLTLPLADAPAKVEPIKYRNPRTPEVPEAPDDPTAVSAYGECYLALWRHSHHDRVKEELGFNPWGPAVVSRLLEEPGNWSDARFVVSFGSMGPEIGQHYIQAHVAVREVGLKVKEVIPLLLWNVRVGAPTGPGPNANALLNVQEADAVAVQPTVFNMLPSAPSRELSFSVSAIVGGNAKRPNFAWSVMNTPMFAAMVGVYESVRIESAEFEVQVLTGSANAMYCAITDGTVDLKEFETWIATPVNAIIRGSDQGAVVGKFALPEVHPFSKEIRGVREGGNPPPVFSFAYSGSVGTFGTVKGRVRLSVAGQAIIGHINIGGVPDAKQFLMGLSNATGLSIKPLRAPEIEEDESDDEDEDVEEIANGPVERSSPPTANTSARRA